MGTKSCQRLTVDVIQLNNKILKPVKNLEVTFQVSFDRNADIVLRT